MSDQTRDYVSGQIEQSVSDAGGDNYEVLEAGPPYLCTLAPLKDYIGRKYDSDEPQVKVILSFEVDDKENAFISALPNKKFNLGKYETALVTYAKMMGAKEGDLQGPDTLDKFLLGSVGKKFLVTCEPSGNGKYNNLVSIMVPPGMEDQTGTNEARGEQVFKDDDVPF